MADGLIIVGALTAVAGAIRANFASVPFFRSRAAEPSTPEGRAIATLECAYACTVAAVITGAGITVMVLGLVIGYGVQTWTILMPIGLAAAAALTAGFIRRTLRQLPNSA
jgi:hypothetical protein